MSSDLEQEIQKKVQALPETKQQRVLTLIDEFLSEAEGPPPSTARPIWEIFEQLSQQVPLEEWSKLPSDGAEQHDHYLRGLAKERSKSMGRGSVRRERRPNND